MSAVIPTFKVGDCARVLNSHTGVSLGLANALGVVVATRAGEIQVTVHPTGSMHWVPTYAASPITAEDMARWIEVRKTRD